MRRPICHGLIPTATSIALLATIAAAPGCGTSGPGFRTDRTEELRATEVDPRRSPAIERAVPRGNTDDATRDAEPLHDADGRLRLGPTLRHALAASPSILGAREHARAAAAKGEYAGALPDPMLRLGWYAESVETRTGPQKWSLAVQQAIPWPGALAAATDVARLVHRVADARAAIATRDVLVDVAQTYHELDYIARAKQTTARIRSAIERLAQFAARGNAGAPATVPETVRAETWLAQVKNDALLLDELERTERAKLRALLGLGADAPIGAPLGVTPPALEVSVDELCRGAEDTNHDLLAANLEVERAERDTDLLASRAYPRFAVGGRYIATERRKDADPRDNGEDPLFLELGISIPIWFGANSAASREGRSRTRSAEHRRDAVRHRLRADITRAYWRAANAERLWRLHRDTFVPQAARAAAASESLFDEGHASFASVVESVAAWHHLELAMHRARADYAQAIAAMERLLGVPLVRRSEAAR